MMWLLIRMISLQSFDTIGRVSQKTSSLSNLFQLLPLLDFVQCGVTSDETVSVGVTRTDFSTARCARNAAFQVIETVGWLIDSKDICPVPLVSEVPSFTCDRKKMIGGRREGDELFICKMVIKMQVIVLLPVSNDNICVVKTGR